MLDLVLEAIKAVADGKTTLSADRREMTRPEQEKQGSSNEALDDCPMDVNA
jgi:hypothetical protein